jgi:hypothetical protein
MMSRFFLLFEQWDLASAAAWRAEAVVARHLDAYCEGTGRAPTREEIAEAKVRRGFANTLFRAMRAHLVDERESLPVL